jgi:hypothetical protein
MRFMRALTYSLATGHAILDTGGKIFVKIVADYQVLSGTEKSILTLHFSLFI